MKTNVKKKVAIALTVALSIPFMAQYVNVYAETNPANYKLGDETETVGVLKTNYSNTNIISKEPDVPTVEPTATPIATSVPTVTATPTPATNESTPTQNFMENDTPASVTGEKADGDATAVDYTYQNEKKFYTFKTKDGNTYYMIVDNEKTSDNVYFLTEISDAQLKNSGTSPTVSPTVTATPTPAVQNTTTEKKSNNTLMIALIILVVGAGAGYYFKIVKPKQAKTKDDVQDDDLVDEEDDDLDNENEE